MRSLASAGRSPCATSFASPKSSSFADVTPERPAPPVVSITLPGFRSRWTMPCLCAASRASAICAAMSSACASGTGPRSQALGERLAGEMFHDEVGRAVVAADVVERADVRVRERGDGAGLPLEARAAVRIGAQFGGEDLDGDRAVEAGVAGLVDLAHAAGADSRLDLVGSEASPGDEAHGHGLRGALYAALSRSCAWPENLASVPEQGGPGGAHDFGQEDYSSSLSPLKPVSENGCLSVHSPTRGTRRNCSVFVSSTQPRSRQVL